jgi:hypothetical protein
MGGMIEKSILGFKGDFRQRLHYCPGHIPKTGVTGAAPGGKEKTPQKRGLDGCKFFVLRTLQLNKLVINVQNSSSIYHCTS